MKMDIYFRALEPDDAKFINEMRRLSEMTDLTGEAPRLVSLEREKKFVTDLIMGDLKDRMYFAICENGDDKIIGYSSISDIDYFNRSCFWSGTKISPAYSGKGYGFQQGLLLLKFAFEKLGMNRVTGMSHEDHDAVKKLLTKCGMKIEGLQRDYIYKNGKFTSFYLWSMLRNEYFEIKKKYDL